MSLRSIQKALASLNDQMSALRLVMKAHVKAHIRTLDDGRTIWVKDHDTQREGRAATIHERTAVGKHRDGTHYIRASDKEDSGDIQRAILRLGLGGQARYKRAQANHLGQKGGYDHFHFEDASHVKAVHDELRKLKDLPEEMTPNLFEAAGLGPDGVQRGEEQGLGLEEVGAQESVEPVMDGHESTHPFPSFEEWSKSDSAPKIIKQMQRHDSGTRANLAASHRLTPGQRASIGESFYTRDDGTMLAYPTRKAAMLAAYREAKASAADEASSEPPHPQDPEAPVAPEHSTRLQDYAQEGQFINQPAGAGAVANVDPAAGESKGDAPKDGDERTINGRTYRLVNGRWHRIGEDDNLERLTPHGWRPVDEQGEAILAEGDEPEAAEATPADTPEVDQDPNTLGPGDKIQFNSNFLDFEAAGDKLQIGGTIVKRSLVLSNWDSEPAPGYQVIDDKGRSQLILPSAILAVTERTSHIKREGGDYEDFGDKIGGARKDIAALKLKYDREDAGLVTLDDAEAMEQDPAFASKMITRENVLQPKHAIRDLRDMGMSPGAAFVMRRLMNAIPAKPGDSPEERKLFLIGCNRIREAFTQVRTAPEAEDVVKDLLQELHGIAILPEDMPENLAHKAAMERTDNAYRAAYREALGPEFDWNTAYKSAAAALEAKGSRLGTANLMRKAADMAWSEKHKVDADRRSLADAWAKTEDGMEMDAARKQAKLDYQKFLAHMKDKTEATPWNTAKGIKSLGAKLQETLGSTDTAKSYNARASVHQRLRNLHHDAQKLDTANDWSWFKDETEPSEKTRAASKPQVPAWTRTVPDQVERIGGSDATHTAKTIAETFGVRGVEYGNWVNDEEAQSHTKAAGNALGDLADILGIDPKTISLNGRLAIAFGARGNGHGMAHFESNTKAINLTKTAGGGCLAHEWGHALDNIMAQASFGDTSGHSSFFSEGEGSKDTPPEVAEAWNNLITTMSTSKDSEGWPMVIKRGKTKFRNHAASDALLEQAKGNPSLAMKEWLATAGAEKLQRYRERGGRGSYMLPYVAKFKSEVQQQARYFLSMSDPDRFDKCMFTLPKVDPDEEGPTAFKADAIQRGKYWEQPKEMFARAFEAFVEDELEANGRRNTYLVTGTKSGPYPRQDERARINDAMRNLVGVLKNTRAIEKALKPKAFNMRDAILQMREAGRAIQKAFPA